MPPVVSQQKQLRPDQQMQVIKSDQDLSEEIDIRATQVSKVAAAAKEEARNHVKNHGMEIIRGDESVEDRIASLRGKNDLGSIAERARLKASGATRMQIVKDDSLGAGFGGKNAISMNAGQHLPSREEADARKGDAEASAAARKKEVELRRKTAGLGEEDPTPAPVEVTGEATEIVDAPDATQVENANLKSENADLKARMDRMEAMIMNSQKAAPKRGRPAKVVPAAVAGEG